MIENRIQIMRVHYNTPLKFAWIPKFRGAVNRLLEHEHLLFHNHQQAGGLRYSYPLIQYKKVQDKACVIGVNAGAEELGAILAHPSQHVDLGDHSVFLELEEVKVYQHVLQVWDTSDTFIVRKYLPLNENNHAEFNRLSSEEEKVRLLERILVGNILSMAKGLGIFFDRQIECHIEEILGTRVMDHKNTSLMSFDLRFSTNVSLPMFLGIGKGSSHGFGMIYKAFTKTINTYE